MDKAKFVVSLPVIFTTEVDPTLQGIELEKAIAEETAKFLATLSPKRIRSADDFAFYPAGEVESVAVTVVTD
jgi:hypothetical protein